MMPKKSRPSIADPAVDEAVTQLSALTFAHPDPTALGKYRGYIVPGAAVRGTPGEEQALQAARIEALDDDGGESDDEDVGAEEPDIKEWSTKLEPDEPKQLDQNYIALDDGNIIHVGDYLGEEWENAIVGILPRATRMLC
jgi:hypothetical protein